MLIVHQLPSLITTPAQAHSLSLLPCPAPQQAEPCTLGHPRLCQLVSHTSGIMGSSRGSSWAAGRKVMVFLRCDSGVSSPGQLCPLGELREPAPPQLSLGAPNSSFSGPLSLGGKRSPLGSPLGGSPFLVCFLNLLYICKQCFH